MKISNMYSYSFLVTLKIQNRFCQQLILSKNSRFSLIICLFVFPFNFSIRNHNQSSLNSTFRRVYIIQLIHTRLICMVHSKFKKS